MFFLLIKLSVDISIEDLLLMDRGGSFLLLFVSMTLES